MKEFFAKIWASLVSFWRMLPKEIRVAAFIAASYGMADVIVALEAVEMNNTILAIILNIILVFLKELKPRINRSKQQ